MQYKGSTLWVCESMPNIIYVALSMYGTAVNPGFLGLSFRLYFMLIQLTMERKSQSELWEHSGSTIMSVAETGINDCLYYVHILWRDCFENNSVTKDISITIYYNHGFSHLGHHQRRSPADRGDLQYPHPLQRPRGADSIPESVYMGSCPAYSWRRVGGISCNREAYPGWDGDDGPESSGASDGMSGWSNYGH